MLHRAGYEWRGKEEVWTFSGDILAAFDELDMLIAEGGMTAAGTHPGLVASVLEERRHLKLHCNYQELSTVTDFNGSLKQGGKESEARW